MYWNLKRVLTTLLIVGFIGSIFYYAYYQSRGIISGPQIHVVSPENGTTVTDPLLHINGTTQRAKALTLDGREIFIDLEGKFGEELLLAPGYNIIELAARDADGHDTKQTLEVVYSGDGNRSGLSSSSTINTATGTTPINN